MSLRESNKSMRENNAILHRIEEAEFRRFFAHKKFGIKSYKNEFERTKEFILKRMNGLPEAFQNKLLKQYCKRYASKTAKNPQRSANIFLRKSTRDALNIIRKSGFTNKESVIDKESAKKEAEFCANLALKITTDVSQLNKSYRDKLVISIEQIEDKIISNYMINSPIKISEMKDENYMLTIQTLESALAKLICEKWWTRKIEKLRIQTHEFINIKIGEVNKLNPYCSNHRLREFKTNRKDSEHFLEMMNVVNVETGDTTELSEIAKKTATNPEIRRIELMVRARGIEEIAKESEQKCLFVTLTAPSKYHPSSRKYKEKTPKEAQEYLNKTWSKIRAKLKRMKTEYCGIRVAEPHKDGCPHWHLLIYSHAINDIECVIKDYSLREDGLEQGAQKNRVDFKEIDLNEGSGTAYISKYISKNLNANHIDEEYDFETKNKKLGQTVDRVVAWATAWRIRQFQFFGTEKISIWRELRRIANIRNSKIETSKIKEILEDCDNSRWAEFTKKAKKLEIKIKREIEEANFYGELTKKIKGLVINAREYISRIYIFKLERKKSQGLKSEKMSGSSFTWCPVNNCTD